MRLRAPARPLVCALLCLAAAGCAGGGSSTSGGSTPSSSPTTGSPSSPSGTSTLTDSPAPSDTGSVSTSPEPTAVPHGLPGRLLGADELPGFNARYRWAAGTTGPENPSASFGTCQRFAVTSIGAERVLVRRFRPAEPVPGRQPDRAGELVAQFPDPQTARRAFSVLKAWRAGCADRLRGHTRPRVGPLRDVAVDGGSAGWYLLTYGPVKGDPDSQFFDAQGMAVVGSRIAMVALVAAGQDYDYDPGKEPMVQAVQRAAHKLS
jgi:hypothetical protein